MPIIRPYFLIPSNDFGCIKAGYAMTEFRIAERMNNLVIKVASSTWSCRSHARLDLVGSMLNFDM